MENFTGNFGWIEMVFSFGVVFAFGFYQLWSVNREIKRDKEKKQQSQSGSDTGHAIGEHELDDR